MAKQELNSIRVSNLYKDERIIISDQKAKIKFSYPAESTTIIYEKPNI